MYPSALPLAWRGRAEDLERFAPPAAEAFRACAAELEEALRNQEDDLLDPPAAEADCRYSRRTLREQEAAGKLKNYGRKGAPLYRRGDLPRKPARAQGGAYDAAADARATLAGGGR